MPKFSSLLFLRLCKIALIAVCSLFFCIVVFNNIVDYGSNYDFVQHVLSMDDTFKGNKLMDRSFTNPVVYQVFYASIITWEAVNAIALAIGALFLLRAAWADSESAFLAAKSVASVGLTLSMLLWFLAFITVGGEWFVMWQSHIWNGQEAAFRMFTINGIILIFLWQSEPALGVKA